MGLKNSAELNSSSATSSALTATNSSAMTSASSSSQIKNSSSTPALIAYGSDRMQVGELRLPATKSDKPFPLVIIIHGGCWVSSYADYHFMDRFAQPITDLGYATWNIEYRALGTGGEWPVIFQDISKAVDYTRNLAKTYPIDVNKVAIIGHSAGGHLALWAASRTSLKSSSEIYTENPLPIRGVISLAGIANITSGTGCNTLANNVIGVPINSPSSALTARLRETSPLQMLPSRTNTILISGSADGIVPAAIGTEYSNKATELGDHSLHYNLEGLGHFDLIDVNSTNWSLYQQSLQEFFKD
jgi:acetyl esterase/lipase